MRISDWSSDVCSSDLHVRRAEAVGRAAEGRGARAGPCRSRPGPRLCPRGRAGLAFGRGGVGARLVKWTSAGNLGWVFDNEEDSMSLDARFVGFAMPDFLENAEIRTPVMLYFLERIDAPLTGELKTGRE